MLTQRLSREVALAEPIGIFDSGIGGVSILIEIRKLLPEEDIVYVADSRYCPYGTKAIDIIRERTLKITAFLKSQGAKAIVVACNTACSAGLDEVRIKNPELPVIGVEPAVKPAHSITKNGRIGVLSTNLTLSGQRFAMLTEKFGNGVEIFTQPAPGLADLIDAGKKDAPETSALLSKYIAPLIAQGIDTLVLGCTHYPFVRKEIQRLCGNGVAVIDTGEPVAKQTERVLRYRGLLAAREGAAGSVKFFTTGKGVEVQSTLASIWSGEIKAVTEIEV